MWKVMMPRKIVYGANAASEFQYPENSLVITTTTPDIYEKWLNYMGIKKYEIYDKVTPDPAIEKIEEIKKKYEGKEISAYIGLGGGSSMDVCKYLGKLTGILKF
jgi:succinate semialdehyde reductase